MSLQSLTNILRPRYVHSAVKIGDWLKPGGKLRRGTQPVFISHNVMILPDFRLSEGL